MFAYGIKWKAEMGGD